MYNSQCKSTRKCIKKYYKAHLSKLSKLTQTSESNKPDRPAVSSLILLLIT